RVWADADGRDTVGCVLVQDQIAFAAREVQKADARPGGYTTTGGHGGIVAAVGEFRPPVLTFRPARRHTHTSAVNLTRLPESVEGARATASGIERVRVAVKDAGGLRAEAIPMVHLVKTGQWDGGRTAQPREEPAIATLIDQDLRAEPLAGFVA